MKYCGRLLQCRLPSLIPYLRPTAMCRGVRGITACPFSTSTVSATTASSSGLPAHPVTGRWASAPSTDDSIGYVWRSSVRYRCDVKRPWLSSYSIINVPLCNARRGFVNKLESLVTRTITPAIERLKGALVFADERLVTEPRRKLVRQSAMEENLTERLARQRRVRQGLVPTEIRVDRSKLSITFTWPIEAVQLVQLQAPNEVHQSSAARRTAAEDDQRMEGEEIGQKHATSAAVSSSAAAQHRATSMMGTSSSTESMKMMKTTALAEYLRVMTPSTDGTFATDRVVYGRRGITIRGVTPVGNYAVRIGFSDDHDAGIYSYDYLFHLTCPEHKYRLMREYIRALKKARKSREPPRRAASVRRFEKSKPPTY